MRGNHYQPHSVCACPSTIYNPGPYPAAAVQVRTRQRHKTRPRALPGWGNVANPEDWKVVDEAPEHLLTNAANAGGPQPLAAAPDLPACCLAGNP